MEDRLSKLRALAETPSYKGWIEIVVELEQHDGLSSEHVHAAQELLHHWPSDMRVAPKPWLERWKSGVRDPRLLLASKYDLIDEVHYNDGGAELLSSPALASLQELVICNNSIDARGIEALLGTPHGQQLRSLFIDGEGIDLDLVDRLAASPPPRLEGLVLLGGHVGDAGAKRIASSRLSLSLTQLHLHDTGVGKEGAHALAESETMHPLVRLEWRRLIEEGTFPIPAHQHFG